MHRIDVPSATPDHLFTEGSPTGGVPATIVPADWLNDLQENVCQAILSSGLPLTKGRALDLFDAITAVATGGVQTNMAALNGYRRERDGYFEMWGFSNSGAEPVTVIFPYAFTTLFGVFLQCASTVTPTTATSFNVQAINSGFTVTRNDGTNVEPFYWRAQGYRAAVIP